jgi:hypothetical protein
MTFIVRVINCCYLKFSNRPDIDHGERLMLLRNHDTFFCLTQTPGTQLCLVVLSSSDSQESWFCILSGTVCQAALAFDMDI